ncbi:Phospholipase/Carboxylesterase [Gimesia algae]|uniref:Phospholipase/Carboxylesterase n=2 Tax=Gimesia algae TaxID=2527971 RepID=A0A517V609_9PLAN|nr:Phospholipase/Carboxylesterase [Gimesia algae]
MNPRYYFTLAWILLIPFSSNVSISAEPEVLLKDSFEAGTKAPEDWQSGFNVPGVRYVYDKGRGKSGDRSLSLQKSARRYFPIAQWYRLLPYSGEKQQLQAQCEVRAEQATKAIIDALFLDENQKSLGHQWLCYIGSKQADDPPANHDWKTYTGSAEIPENTKQIVIGLQIYGPGKVWFDDLEVTLTGESAPAEPDQKAKAIDVKINRETGQYLLITPKDKPAANKPRALLIVLPGGDGSANFHPFVNRIYEHALRDDFVLAQPIAKKWTSDQKIVWPTAASHTAKMKFTTEELIKAVKQDVSEKQTIDPQRIYLLAWSSGGPAAYAALLQKETDIDGALIAMSVFKPDQLPDPANAKQRSLYLLHSPDDKVCPYHMAETARDTFKKANVRATLVDYSGGHGWKGNVYGNIRQGIDWLEKAD